VLQALKQDGTWMVVEPAAGDRLEDNVNSVSRLCYTASAMICVPTSLDQPVGAALGAQAGFARISSRKGGRFCQCAQGNRDAFQHGGGSAALTQSGLCTRDMSASLGRLNDISVLSKSCCASSLHCNKAAI
jgi:hypothetical protein